MKKTNVMLVLVAVCLLGLWSMDALASTNAEDQVIGIVERVLNLIADFFDKIFQSIADAVRSVWSPSEK